MGLISKLYNDYIKPAKSPEEIRAWNMSLIEQNSGETRVQVEEIYRTIDFDPGISEPNFTVYSDELFLTGRYGIEDPNEPNYDQVRTGYRSFVSMLASMRADKIAAAMCFAEVKRQTGPKSFEDVEDGHPWKRILMNPSPDNMSPYEFWYDVSILRDLSKGAFAMAGYDSANVPNGFFLIYPFFGRVNASPSPNGGIQEYVYLNNHAESEFIPADQMMWFKHRSPVSPYEAASLIAQAAYQSDTDLYQAIYGRNISAEGNVPGVYASFNTNLTQDQMDNYGRKLTKEYFSLRVRQKVLVLGGDAELKAVGVSPDDLAYIASKQLNEQDLVKIFKYPPAMFEAGGVVANSEVTRKEWLRRLENETAQLCQSLTFQMRLVFDAKESDLVVVPPVIVDPDPVDRERVREAQIRTGQRSPNYFRIEDQLEPYEGGDNYYIMAGLTEIAGPGVMEDEMTTEDEPGALAEIEE